MGAVRTRQCCDKWGKWVHPKMWGTMAKSLGEQRQEVAGRSSLGVLSHRGAAWGTPRVQG